MLLSHFANKTFWSFPLTSLFQLASLRSEVCLLCWFAFKSSVSALVVCSYCLLLFMKGKKIQSEVCICSCGGVPGCCLDRHLFLRKCLGIRALCQLPLQKVNSSTRAWHNPRVHKQCGCAWQGLSAGTHLFVGVGSVDAEGCVLRAGMPKAWTTCFSRTWRETSPVIPSNPLQEPYDRRG